MIVALLSVKVIGSALVGLFLGFTLGAFVAVITSAGFDKVDIESLPSHKTGSNFPSFARILVQVLAVTGVSIVVMSNGSTFLKDILPAIVLGMVVAMIAIGALTKRLSKEVEHVGRHLHEIVKKANGTWSMSRQHHVISLPRSRLGLPPGDVRIGLRAISRDVFHDPVSLATRTRCSIGKGGYRALAPRGYADELKQFVSEHDEVLGGFIDLCQEKGIEVSLKIAQRTVECSWKGQFFDKSGQNLADAEELVARLVEIA